MKVRKQEIKPVAWGFLGGFLVCYFLVGLSQPRSPILPRGTAKLAVLGPLPTLVRKPFQLYIQKSFDEVQLRDPQLTPMLSPDLPQRSLPLDLIDTRHPQPLELLPRQ